MLQKLTSNYFFTLFMAENRLVEHYNKILQQTDNIITISTNYPLHCALHFIHQFRPLKKKYGKMKKISGWVQKHTFLIK